MQSRIEAMNLKNIFCKSVSQSYILYYAYSNYPFPLKSCLMQKHLRVINNFNQYDIFGILTSLFLFCCFKFFCLCFRQHITLLDRCRKKAIMLFQSLAMFTPSIDDVAIVEMFQVFSKDWKRIEHLFPRILSGEYRRKVLCSRIKRAQGRQ